MNSRLVRPFTLHLSCASLAVAAILVPGPASAQPFDPSASFSPTPVATPKARPVPKKEKTDRYEAGDSTAAGPRGKQVIMSSTPNIVRINPDPSASFAADPDRITTNTAFNQSLTSDTLAFGTRPNAFSTTSSFSQPSGGGLMPGAGAPPPGTRGGGNTLGSSNPSYGNVGSANPYDTNGAVPDPSEIGRNQKRKRSRQ